MKKKKETLEITRLNLPLKSGNFVIGSLTDGHHPFVRPHPVTGSLPLWRELVL